MTQPPRLTCAPGRGRAGGGASRQWAWHPWTRPGRAPPRAPTLRSPDLGRLAPRRHSLVRPRPHGQEGAAAAAAAAAGRGGPRRPPAAVRPHPRRPGAARPQGARERAGIWRSPRSSGPGQDRAGRLGPSRTRLRARAWPPGPRALRSQPGGWDPGRPQPRPGPGSRARRRRFRGTQCWRPKSRELPARRFARHGAAEGCLSASPGAPQAAARAAPPAAWASREPGLGAWPDGVRQALGLGDPAPTSAVVLTVCRGSPAWSQRGQSG